MNSLSLRSAFIIICCLLLGGCGAEDPGTNGAPKRSGESITVSAAVSLKDAFTEIGELYKARTGRSVDFNFGASGTLQQQIENGAPVDVFASAGERQMEALAEKDLLVAGSRKDFARNSLVLITPKGSEKKIVSFLDLVDPAVEKIAVGNPKTVPAGQYAAELLAKVGLQEKLHDKLILAENVRQVLDYVVRGEVDAGIVYSTDARQAGSEVNVAATADETSHSPIQYPIAGIVGGKHPEAAKEFIDLVLSSEGQVVLRKYGFISPDAK
ncbi:MAG TPA: molybdate ABC transporter substrate-binding protein [Pyrinomonadaceae bacterium]|nr:molybdate ABC transporter substrate-binding protein [Pyrinomonadaceae bacterium]